MHAVVSRQEAGEDAAPALVGSLGVVRWYAIVGQGQLASMTFRPDLDGDGGHSRIELGHAESENEPPRPINLQIFADLADVAHVRAALGECEAAADTRLNLRRDHFSCRRGEQKAARGLNIQKGVEDSLGRSSVAVGDHDAGWGLCGHGFSSVKTLSSSP